MSHIRQKFNDYKQELRLIYNNDLQHKRLDISSQSMKELLSKGYFIRKMIHSCSLTSLIRKI
ncbi:MAG: hypothetical protein HGGPFJEG_01895 [Ignavibacteria bacterium]|nr:hypothetical protein [Ignavibacteria bacterium]